jgi:osmotically-inducible protein OsmY
VRLNGAANSEAEKERAATIARSMDGVVEVRNDIQVKPARQDP